MYPSDYVEEVLSSPEFKTWMSDEQIDRRFLVEVA